MRLTLSHPQGDWIVEEVSEAVLLGRSAITVMFHDSAELTFAIRVINTCTQSKLFIQIFLCISVKRAKSAHYQRNRA